MKKLTKVMIAGVGVGIAIGAAIIVKQHLIINHDDTSVSIIGGADGPTSIFIAGKIPGGSDEMSGYTSIPMEAAKDIFEIEGDYVILDVRRADEFAQGHIPGAVNIANEDINDTELEGLQDKDKTIYVYCRSGNRSKQAAQKLADMGYTNIIEIGGIKDWTGEVEK